MAAGGRDDVSEVLGVLRRNGADSCVDKECLKSLVESCDDEDRVESVISQLEEILGRKFAIRNSSDRSGGPGADYSQALARDYLARLVDVLPDVNIKFAVYKACEAALWQTNDFDSFVRDCVSESTYLRTSDPFELASGHDKVDSSMFTSVLANYIEEQVNFVIRSVPDVDPDFVARRVTAVQGNPVDTAALVDDLLQQTGNNPTYPTRFDHDKRLECQRMANTLFSVQDLLDMFDDPIAHFYDQTRPTTFEYRLQAVNELRTEFRHVNARHISDAFRQHDYHYAPCRRHLLATAGRGQHRALGQSSSRDLLHVLDKDAMFILELAFVRIEQDIVGFVKAKQSVRRQLIDGARQTAALIECPICCDDELIDDDLITCAEGHAVCHHCIARQCCELLSVTKIHVACLSVGCRAEYSLADLKRCLKPSAFAIVAQRRQVEDVMNAAIPGLISCPFCDYCEILSESDKIFQCRNVQCGKQSCRECRQVNHLPLRCVESGQETRLRKMVEEKLTLALARQCHRCKKLFLKTDGCNKMTCVCGAIMCYVCKQPVAGYDHFSDRTCPLWTPDLAGLHGQNLAAAQRQARTEILAQNPRIDLDYLLVTKPPK